MRFKTYLQGKELTEAVGRRQAGRLARRASTPTNVFKEIGLTTRRFEGALEDSIDDVAEMENPILNLKFNPPNKITFDLAARDVPEDYDEPFPRQEHLTKKQLEKSLKQTAKNLRVNLKLEKFKKGRANRTSLSSATVSIEPK